MNAASPDQPWFGQDGPDQAWLDQHGAEYVWNGLPENSQTLLLTLRHLAGPEARVALVGGAVRDILLGQASASPDLDIVLEQADVLAVAQSLKVPLSWHPAYHNATLHLPGEQYADLVSARRESYPVAGGPPTPLPGTLEDDLARRDFTVNSAALELLTSGAGTARRRLLSVPHFAEDLRARRLRPLHARSFYEDASRLVRGARLAARLGLKAHPDLLAQVPAALEIAPKTPRLAAELKLLLGEPRPGKAARVLSDWGSDWGAASLLPAGAADLLERLDALPGQHRATLYAAALMSLVPQTDELDSSKLGSMQVASLQLASLQLGSLQLGSRPAELLARARSSAVAAPGSAEAALQTLLGLSLPYAPLQGRDLLALGLHPGPDLGRLLHWLAEQRRQRSFGSTEDERNAVLDRLRHQQPE